MMSSLPPSTRCLVTGASDPTSVGYACAQALLEAGAAAVTITGRHAATLEAAVQSLSDSKSSPKAASVYSVVSDLTRPETMEATVNEAVSQMGGGSLHILVISGGNGGSEWLGLDAQDPASYTLLQAVSVLSPMKLTHAAVDVAATTVGSSSSPSSFLSVVMVSSQAANTPWPDTAPYNINKAAQNCLVQQLAFQYRNNHEQNNNNNCPVVVRVNAVLPACIHTGALDRMAAKKKVSIEDYAALRAQSHPLQRNGTPRDVAQAVLFLASPHQSAFTTGTLLPVDGGLHLSNWFNQPRLLAEFQGNKKLDG